MNGNLRSKNIIFIALMASLGNVLSAISIQLSPIVPALPLGPINFSLALDLSHITTFVAAFFGGEMIGGLTGLIGGLVAAFEFGFSKGNFITGFGLPIGKALTGVASGYLMAKFNLSRNFIRIVFSTVVSYIPEGIFTFLLFVLLFPPLFGLPVIVANAIAIQIVVKALFEMVVIGIVLKMLLNNQGFNDYVKGYFK